HGRSRLEHGHASTTQLVFGTKGIGGIQHRIQLLSRIQVAATGGQRHQSPTMKFRLDTHIIRLGRILPALVFLAVVGAVCLSYYRRSLYFHDPSEREKKLLPENITAATEGFSFLQSEQGQARFEIKAKINLGFKDNKNLLESATVKVFGKDGTRHDTITSDHCEYDQEKEEIVFSGNVVIKLSHGSIATAEAKVEPPPNDTLTAVQMDKITFLKSSGKAQTDDPVQFA